MHSFSKFFTGMKPANIKKLEDKLAAVSNIMYSNNGISAARLRLKEWKGIDNFTLVSDKECHSPFAMQDATCAVINTSMIISVIKDDINVRYKDESGDHDIKFVIKK